MVPLLALDACAALHLKQVSDASRDAIGMLDQLVSLGVAFVTTRKVEGEHREMSLSAWLDRWSLDGCYGSERVSLTERKAIRNRVGRLRPMPGNKDLDLVIVARRVGGVLFTHDGPAARLANKVRVLTVDAIDVAALLVDRGRIGWDEADHLLAGLDGFAWRPDDWAGAASATCEARTRWPKLLGHLHGWLGVT